MTTKVPRWHLFGAFALGPLLAWGAFGASQCNWSQLSGQPKSDADAGDPAVLACSKLKGWGCPIADSPYCAQTFRLPTRFGLDPRCVLDAGTVDDMRATCHVVCRVTIRNDQIPQ